MAGNSLSQETKAKTQEQIGPPLPKPEDLQQSAIKLSKSIDVNPATANGRLNNLELPGANNTLGTFPSSVKLSLSNAMLSEAMGIAKRTQGRDRCATFTHIAKKATAVGNKDLALEALAIAEDGAAADDAIVKISRDEILSNVAKGLADAAQNPAHLAKAVDLAVLHGGKYTSVTVLADCARSAASMGSDSLASNWSSHALSMANTLGPTKYNWEKMKAVASNLAAAGKRPEALQLFGEVEEYISQQGSPYSQTEFVVSMHQAGFPKEATEFALKLNSNFRKSTALAQLANEMKNAGNIPEALKMYDKAAHAAIRMEDSEIQDDSTHKLHLASDIIRLGGSAETISKLIDSAHKDIPQVKDDSYRREAWASLAVVHAQNGKFTTALKLTSQIETDFTRIDALCQIACIKDKVGMDGTHILDKAKNIALSIKAGLGKESDLCGVATAYAKTGNFEEAADLASKITDAWFSVKCHTAVGVSMAAAGKDASSMFNTAREQALAIRDGKVDVSPLFSTTPGPAALQRLAEGYATAGNIRKASQTIALIKNPVFCAKRFADLAEHLAQLEK